MRSLLLSAVFGVSALAGCAEDPQPAGPQGPSMQARSAGNQEEGENSNSYENPSEQNPMQDPGGFQQGGQPQAYTPDYPTITPESGAYGNEPAADQGQEPGQAGFDEPEVGKQGRTPGEREPLDTTQTQQRDVNQSGSGQEQQKVQQQEVQKNSTNFARATEVSDLEKLEYRANSMEEQKASSTRSRSTAAAKGVADRFFSKDGWVAYAHKTLNQDLQGERYVWSHVMPSETLKEGQTGEEFGHMIVSRKLGVSEIQALRMENGLTVLFFVDRSGNLKMIRQMSTGADFENPLSTPTLANAHFIIATRGRRGMITLHYQSRDDSRFYRIELVDEEVPEWSEPEEIDSYSSADSRKGFSKMVAKGREAMQKDGIEIFIFDQVQEHVKGYDGYLKALGKFIWKDDDDGGRGLESIYNGIKGWFD